MQTYKVKCRVSGGVTGTRESYLKAQDGSDDVFDTLEHAQAIADHYLSQTSSGPDRALCSAHFEYWPEAMKAPDYYL